MTSVRYTPRDGKGPLHVGRSWTGTTLEDNCPCEKGPCGLVAVAVPECPEHWPAAAKTIRQAHRVDQCKGGPAR